MQVTPAVLAYSFNELQEKVERVSSFAKRVQIDIYEGTMNTKGTWMPTGDEKLPYSDIIEYEADIFVSEWRDMFQKVLKLHIGRVIMHVDSFSEDDCKELAKMCSQLQITLGLVVSNDVELSQFDACIRTVQHYYRNIFIQVMGIRKVGEQGQFFDEDCLNRIKHSKQTYGDLEVQVDGGMRPETAVKVKDAGAEVIVVGSYLLHHDDIAEAYSELVSIE